MSTAPPLSQPVKVSELLGISKSSDKKPTSEKKRLEPVKVKDLLASCSKTAPLSEGRLCRRTFVIPKSGRKPVRRALYEKSTSPKQSPNRNNGVLSSAVKISANKSTRPARKSFLPPPNSIAQRHIQRVINENFQNSTIVEERYSQTHESPPVKYRATVIKNAKSRSSQYKNEEEIVNQSITMPIIVHKESETFIADKENVRPPLDRTGRPLAENEDHHFENLDLQLVDLCRGVITRIEKVERNLEELKSQQAVQIDLLQKIYNLVTIKCESPKVSVDVANDCYTPRILSEYKPPSNLPQADKENVISGKKKKRQSKEIVQERRRSARLAAKSCEKYDSFVALEDELNISNEFTSGKSLVIIETPKNDEQRSVAKSDRPLREYLAMKASMSFLETPEPNGFRRNADSISTGTPQRSKNLRKSISSKLFDELQDLYLDSPGSAPSCP